MKMYLPEFVSKKNDGKFVAQCKKASYKISLIVFFALLAFSNANAQTTITFNFGASTTFNTTTKGYEMPGVGTYFKDNGGSSGTISFSNSTNCFGFTPGGSTSGAAFYFLADFGNISKITINGTGTGSNRTFSNISYSSTQGGTYTVDAGATASGTINSGTCGSIVVVPSAPIPTGTYIKFVISGNLNISSIDFLTGATAPAVTTAAATNVSCSSLTLNGSIDGDGGFSPVTRGFVYSTTNNDPTVGDVASTTLTDAATGVGAFSDNLSSLTQGTTYYVKAYGTNSIGTAYGAVQTITTAVPGVPTLSTTAISNITSFGAATGGDVTLDGCSPITARGVVWDIVTGPVLGSNNFTTDGTGAGTFTSQITGLAASTTYFVRAYATNSSGTAYGDEVSFQTSVAQPALFSSVSSLPFPATTIGTSSSLTYTLTGSTLDGTPITITAPAGFTVSPATITYTGSSFTQVVTVTYTPTSIAPVSGVITQTGGGAVGLYNVSPSVSASGKLPLPAVTSNVGNDFWLGFGYHTDMDNPVSDKDDANLSLYVSAPDKDATVIVEMPGLNGAFTPLTVFIPKGTVQEITGFPRGDNDNAAKATDSRLFYTGVSNRAIHVYSQDGSPIAVWMYTYSDNNSAAGSMIFPTNTWNTSYTVQTYGNNTNSGVPNSFFYVIGQEDSTEFDFTPTVNILDSLSTTTFTSTPTGTPKYLAGNTYHIVLNKGQVFNAMGDIVGKVGQDLSGTTIKSSNCKKLAVFAGNGRCLVDVSDIPAQGSRSGSDNLLQQMFPNVAWGTKYYTTPTKHMEWNLYRIYVSDPTTQVSVNKSAPLTGLVANTYYTYETDTASVIESDKPISVTQFIVSQVYATGHYFTDPITGYSPYGMNGLGDPEMIILSPAQQAITNVNVYSPGFKNNKTLAGAYINVVIPKDGVNSFRLDSALNPTQMVDTGSSNYTGGAALQPAPALIPIASAFMPYAADPNYYWAVFKVDSLATHNLSSVVPFNAIAYGTDDGESYGFNAGTLVKDLTAPLLIQNPYGNPTSSANNTTLKTCLGTDFKIYATLPYQTNKITFGYHGNTHILPNTDTTLLGVGGGNIVPDSTFVLNGQTFYVYKLNRTHEFDTTGNFPISITSFAQTNDGGCLGGGDKTIDYTINVVNGITAKFNIGYNSCVSDTVQLTDQSDGQGYSVVAWKWTYNNGASSLPSPLDTVQNPRFKNPSDNTASNFTLRAVNSIGCYNDKTNSFSVTQTTTVTLNPFEDVCQNAQSFTLTGGSPAGGVYSGRGVSNGVFNPAAAGPGLDTIIYTISAGCGQADSATIRVNPSTALSIAAVGPLCINADAVTLVPNVPGGTFTGTGVTGGTFNPAQAGVGSHQVTYSAGGCAQDASINIVVGDIPVVDATVDNAAVSRGATVTLTGTTTVTGTYAWTADPAGTLGSATALVTTAKPVQPTLYTLTVTTDAHCVASDTVSVSINLPCVHPNRAFTPNGDGQNDLWIIYNGDCVQRAVVSVYNRWGGLVFHSDDYHNDWNGNYKGNRLADATYYYVIQITTADGVQTTYRGNVTIIR